MSHSERLASFKLVILNKLCFLGIRHYNNNDNDNRGSYSGPPCLPSEKKSSPLRCCQKWVGKINKTSSPVTLSSPVHTHHAIASSSSSTLFFSSLKQEIFSHTYLLYQKQLNICLLNVIICALRMECMHASRKFDFFFTRNFVGFVTKKLLTDLNIFFNMADAPNASFFLYTHSAKVWSSRAPETLDLVGTREETKPQGRIFKSFY